MTPTVALAIRIRRITVGSMNALAMEPGFPSSLSEMSARTNDTTAEARRMRTSWSLNWPRISVSRGVEGSSGISSIQIAQAKVLGIDDEDAYHSDHIKQHVFGLAMMSNLLPHQN